MFRCHRAGTAARGIRSWGRIILLLACLGPAAGCRTTPPPVPATARQSLERSLPQRSEYWRRFQLQCRIRIRHGNRTESFTALVSADLPGHVRMEARSAWGQTLGVLVVNGHGSSLWVTGEKVVYRAATSEVLLRQLTGLAMPAEQLAALLVAALPGDDSGNGACAWRRQTLGGTLAGVDLVCADGTYRVRYQPPFAATLADSPSVVTVDHGGWELEARLRQVRRVSDMDVGLFSLSPARGVREIRIGGARP